MYRLKKHEIWASDIAAYLNSELSGEDFLITSPHALMTPAMLAAAPAKEPRLLITDSPPAKLKNSFIFSRQPEIDCTQVLLEFFVYIPMASIHETAVISSEATLGQNVFIGAHAVLEGEVQIGDRVRIYNNVTISGPAHIDQDAVIKDGAIIGSEGYQFVKNEKDHLVHTPQLGTIRIGQRVWVGSNSTVERAALKDTVIEDDVKIDDLVHVGNGSHIGARSLLTASSLVGAGVTLGKEVTLAPSSSIRHSVTIEDQVLVGQGAVVVKDLLEKGAYVGVPAKKLKKS